MNSAIADLEGRTTTRSGESRGVSWWDRDVIALLGLPFDVMTLDQATHAVRRAVRDGRRLFLSTPNTNFAMTALSSSLFRESVLQSDLCVADGMPLVWLARLAGLPLRERVAGADLFEKLLREPGPPIRVYFFGGPDGAAKAAHERVNRLGGALRSVGHCAPGFLSVEALSESRFLDDINRCGPDLLVVALGAVKGQEWLLRNRDRIAAPVITHLGAVVNFTAKTVFRAPVWMRRLGLEWVWRILQEPQLWTRYWHDGRRLASHVARCFLPALASRRRFVNAATTLTAESLRARLATSFAEQRPLLLDLRGIDHLSPDVLGLLLLSKARLPAIHLINVSPGLKRSLRRQGLDLNLNALP